MRVLLAKIFRLLFKVSFFKKRFFGIHKRIFGPLNLFKGVIETVRFNNDIILELDIGDWIQENIYFLGGYEDAELQFIQSSLKEDNIFIDIGANIGVHSLFASKLVGKNGKVISFEPFRQNYNALNKNIALNGSTNVVTENLALFKTETILDIYYNTNEANLGMASSYLTEFSCVEKIKAVALDSYLKTIPQQKVDFIKIDIEGGEYDALLGMKSTLMSFYPKLLIEILDHNELTESGNKKNIVGYLENMGYTKYYINDDGELSITETNKDRMNFAFVKEVVNNLSQ